ncbi:MAG: PEP-CTERM sorting domain-containing protein [Verrucomicrobiota bacterium]
MTGTAQSAYVTNFDTAVPTPDSAANFAPQDGWIISDAAFDLSFVQTGSAYGAAGQSIGLGGFYEVPSGTTVRLSRVVSEALATSVFSVDLAIINRFAAEPGNFFPDEDRFGVVLSDAGGELFNIDFASTTGENIWQVFVNGIGLTPNSIMASDYNTPLWYTLGMTFAANGLDLEYTVSLGEGINYSGSLAGKASTTLTGVGFDFDVLGATGADAGSNYMLVDNISIPEPSVTLTGLLALGLFAARRRR